MPDAIRECIADDDTTLKAGEILKPMYFLCKRNILAKSSKITIYFIKVSQLLGGDSLPGLWGDHRPQLFSRGCCSVRDDLKIGSLGGRERKLKGEGKERRKKWSEERDLEKNVKSATVD